MGPCSRGGMLDGMVPFRGLDSPHPHPHLESHVVATRWKKHEVGGVHFLG